MESEFRRSIRNRVASLSIPILLGVICWGLPSGVAAQAFPEFPHVENLTEGFRVEQSFSSVAVAPSDSEYLYLGTNRGEIYTSTDGGDSWVEHHLVKFPRVSEFPLRPHLGVNQGMHQFLGAAPSTIPLNRFASVYGWPGTTQWDLPDLIPSDLMDPEPFRIDEVVPPGVTLTDQFATGTVDRLFERNLSWRYLDEMPPRFGFVPPVYRSGRRKQLDVRWLTVHPDDPETAFAVTNDGLFRTKDGGYSWVREFDNPLADRRVSHHVAMYPEDDDIRFLCTQHGLFVTKDDGETYSKVEDSIIARIGCFYVNFHPERPRELWVGTVFGVWVSKDFGETFDLQFYTRVPGQIQIKRVTFDPNDPSNIVLGSNEIAFLSRDGGDSFRRVGVYSFTKQQIVNVTFGREPGHILVATERDIWRTTDWGESWEALYFGDIGFLTKWAFFPYGVDGPLWVLSQAELLSLQRTSPTGMKPGEVDRMKELFEREPSMGATIMQALRSHDAYRPVLNRRRRKARLRNLAPKLQAVGAYRDVNAEFIKRGRLYDASLAAEDGLPRAYATEGVFEDWHFELWGNWDLGALIFNREMLPSGKSFQLNEKLARRLREDIRLVYGERRRIQIKQIADPSGSPRKKLLREMRVEELTELLDIMTRGWFSRYVEGKVDGVEGYGD